MSNFRSTKGRGRGQWWPSQQENGQLSATFYCRDCGRASSLKAHVIASDGTVSPSCVCPHARADAVECPCGFHAYISLVNWSQALADQCGESLCMQARVCSYSPCRSNATSTSFFERVEELRKDPEFQRRAAEDEAESDRAIERIKLPAKAQGDQAP